MQIDRKKAQSPRGISALYFMGMIAFSASFLPTLIHAQTTRQANHTLPRYKDDSTPISGAPSPGLNTPIAGAYADGSPATLAQIARMADGSVQQSEGNRANGYAQLDANGHVTAPLVGDISGARVKMDDTALSRTLAAVLGNTNVVQDYLYADGREEDARRLDHFIASHCGSVIHVRQGFIIPARANGEALFPARDCPAGQNSNWVYEGQPLTTKGTPTTLRTPDDLHESRANGTLSFSKRKKNDTGTAPGIYMQMENEAVLPRVPTGDGGSMAQSVAMLGMNVVQEPGAKASLNGLEITTQDYGTDTNASQVQGAGISTMKHGAGSDWALSLAGYDFSARQPDTVLSYTGLENDVQVNGDDTTAALWDPTQGGRHLVWLGGNTTNSWPRWSPGRRISAGSIIQGNHQLWIAVNDGVTGQSNDPTSTWSIAGIHPDGTVRWKWQYGYDGVISKAIWIVSSSDPAMLSAFDEGIATNARIRNAFIDLTAEHLIDDRAAAIRLRQGDPIDFSGDGTQDGKNQHVIVADSHVTPDGKDAGSLDIRIRNHRTASFADDQSFVTAGRTHLATGADATLARHDHAYPTGLTIGHSRIMPNQTDLVMGQNGLEMVGTDQKGKIGSTPVLTFPATASADGGVTAININTPLHLLDMTQARILALPRQQDGTLLNNVDTGTPVISEHGHWYPLVLGPPLQQVSK
ncbi:hypothetical protein [Komagataeibacter xylinus]|uniref:Uncharacterized protein n=1 Tax=Komagataeibacter xylinus TaxID=28448 RepID=A0A857FP85_KOMXY|nr:hypothetical protein [Komagataeibacter xylinus]QHC35020.1 hypothetical protein FMA36_05445 [Komagataeibacter xylinus]